MRYRAIKDTILSHNGEETLIATSDKVYVEQHAEKWKIFSFYTRKIIAILDKEALGSIFVPESEFRKSPRGDNDGYGSPNKFKDRSFKKFLVVLALSLPLGSMAQVTPVNWSFRAIRVDSNHFEFHMTADIFRGWWIYEPNLPDQCPYSPILTFERSPVMKPVERLYVLDGLICKTYNEMTEIAMPPLCPIPQYRNSVTFVQLFRMPISRLGTVKGQITYQVLSRYVIEPWRTVDFSLNVGGDSSLARKNSTAQVETTYPKGVFKKTWWFLGHPFGPYYTSKKIVTP